VKVVILAGGLGTRLSEETEIKPKPMVEIGGRPVLWHVMKHYAHYGFNEFYVALGYKGDVIKRYFLDYFMLNRSLSINLASGTVSPHEGQKEDWRVHLMETGDLTSTGGRVKRLQEWLNDETFLLTYGDGVSDVDLTGVMRSHMLGGKLATISAVRPPARFGGLELDGDQVVQFIEKPQIGEGWINGGFMVLEPGVFDYIPGDETSFEGHTLERLAAAGQLAAYRHDGFWQCMDTLRDVRLLEGLWQSGNAPWRIWDKPCSTVTHFGATDESSSLAAAA
jgi:glucose-1-phosphate cytidylyltransferase